MLEWLKKDIKATIWILTLCALSVWIGCWGGSEDIAGVTNPQSYTTNIYTFEENRNILIEDYSIGFIASASAQAVPENKIAGSRAIRIKITRENITNAGIALQTYMRSSYDNFVPASVLYKIYATYGETGIPVTELDDIIDIKIKKVRWLMVAVALKSSVIIAEQADLQALTIKE